MVIGAVLGVAAGFALASFAYQQCASHYSASNRQPCVIILVAGGPVVGLAGLLGGYLGRVTADRPDPVAQ